MNHVKIDTSDPFAIVMELDGVNVANKFSGATIRLKAGEIPTVEFDPVPSLHIEIVGEVELATPWQKLIALLDNGCQMLMDKGFIDVTQIGDTARRLEPEYSVLIDGARTYTAGTLAEALELATRGECP